jgi:hypothetical protein
VVRIRSLTAVLAAAGAVAVAGVVVVTSTVAIASAVSGPAPSAAGAAARVRAGAGLRLGLLPGAGPASERTRVQNIGSCRARGDGAGCGIGGTARNPQAVFVHVRARPRQQVSVGWSVRCARHGRHRRDRGTFELRTPVRQGLHLPYPDPAACTVTAQGVLRGHGSLHLWVTARA